MKRVSACDERLLPIVQIISKGNCLPGAERIPRTSELWDGMSEDVWLSVVPMVQVGLQLIVRLLMSLLPLFSANPLLTRCKCGQQCFFCFFWAMSNIVVSSCPVVAASYVPPAARRPLIVTPSSTHFKAASYIIGCFLGSLLHFFFNLFPLPQPTPWLSQPSLHSATLTATLSFFSYKTCAGVRPVPITGGARFPGGRGQVSIRRTQHKKFIGIQAKLSMNQHWKLKT